ncbi:hypothetical protein D3C86_2262000 [compost metagenome]
MVTTQRLPTDDLGDGPLFGFTDISKLPLIDAGDVVTDVEDPTLGLEVTVV